MTGIIADRLTNPYREWVASVFRDGHLAAESICGAVAVGLVCLLGDSDESLYHHCLLSSELGPYRQCIGPVYRGDA